MKFFERKYFPFLLLFIIVFLSRLPFLSAGYGVEEDSWGIALAAFHTHFTGIYEPSRFPGHPIHEFIYSTFWGCAAWTYNLSSAIFSAIATLFFALILKELQFKHFFIGALAFAFIPVVYISSTYSIDFMWTIAFILIAFYLLIKNKFIGVGIFLGLAIGCRITSGAMLLPFILIFWEPANFQNNVKRLLKIVLPLILVTIIAYLPLFLQFGTSFFMYYDQFPYPPFSKVMYKMILGVVGLVGIIATISCFFYSILKKKSIVQGALYENTLIKKVVLASYVITVLYVISYFRLPQKSGYMITVLPFIIILFGYYLNTVFFQFLCGAFILSSFVCSINLTDKLRGAGYSTHAITFSISGQELFFDPFTGPIFSDYSKRLQKIAYCQEVIKKTKLISNKTVIIAGWWYNEIMVTMIPLEKNNLVIFESYIGEEKMNQYISQGYQLYYLPEQNKYNDQMFRIQTTTSMSSKF
jgi:hypothetical protein